MIPPTSCSKVLWEYCLQFEIIQNYLGTKIFIALFKKNNGGTNFDSISPQPKKFTETDWV